MDLNDKEGVRVKDTDLVIPDEGVDDVGMGTVDDRRDMLRLGKVQELRRDFSYLSMFSFVMIIMGTWEITLCMASIVLVDGGTAGFIWMFLICWIFFILINMALGEMASMAPTTGGQYHWISEFAPRKYQKFLSYLMGWLCVLGWQTGCAILAYLAGTQIQGLLVLNYPNYVFERWHGTLLSIAVAAFSTFCCIFFAHKLPIIEICIMLVHIFAFFAVIAVLWALSPVADAKTVFTQFNDGGDWRSLGTASLIGISASAVPLIGGDAAAHMAEELRDASKSLPRSMILTAVVNGALGWVMIITFCFCIGNVQEVLSTPTGYPFIQVFYNATGSTAATTALTSFIIFVSAAGNLTNTVSASRQLFAFARDGGMAFSPWLAQVTPRWNLHVPLNAILVTFSITSLLVLINIGSSTALNSITSLGSNALLSSYICSIGCMIWRRLTGAPLLPAKFLLGKWGLPVTIAAEVFLVILWILSLFPLYRQPDPETMNWSILIYGAVFIFSVGYYWVYGRHHYVGPVEYIRKLD